jgi:hypothetical protein
MSFQGDKNGVWDKVKRKSIIGINPLPYLTNAGKHKTKRVIMKKIICMKTNEHPVSVFSGVRVEKRYHRRFCPKNMREIEIISREMELKNGKMKPISREM